MIRIIMFMFMGALVLQTSCTHKEEKPEHEVRLKVTSPVRMDTAITQDYVCQIHSIQHIELRAQERGYLQKVFVDEGKYVRKGQRLFQIMPKLYEAELLKAKAEANFAEIEYQSTKRLADSNIVAPNELAMAKAKFDKANAELAMAQVHLDFTTISAPFSGIIDRFHVRLGSLVDEGDMLTSLSDNSKMWVYFNVPEAEYLDYKTRVKRDSSIQVQLLMANNKMFAHAGIVETIEADFNNETGNIPFRATFPNPEGLLRHGETGNIQMTIPLKNVLIIPQKATFEVLDKNYVFVVNDNHRVEARQVVIGEEMPHLFVIRKGLTEKDHILLDGLRLVKDGQEISYDYQTPDAVISGLNLYAE